MSDLVERLDRALMDGVKVMEGMVEEIARLRAENERLEARRRELWEQRCDADERIAELEAERDTATLALSALRAALQRIEERAGDMSFSSTSRCGDIGRIVRAALSPGPVS